MKKIKTTALATLLTFSIIANNIAVCQEAVNVQKGQPAPFNGLLLPEKKAKEVKDELLEKDALKKMHESSLESIKLYKDNEKLQNEKSQILLNQNLELIKANKAARTTSTFEKVGLIVLGVGIAGLGVWGASKLK